MFLLLQLWSHLEYQVDVPAIYLLHLIDITLPQFCFSQPSIVNMPQLITRVINLLSAAHEISAKSRKMGWGELCRATILSQRHFPKFLAFTMVSSGLIGYFSMEYIQFMRRQNMIKLEQWDDEQRNRQENYGRSHNEAMLTAMITDSKNKAWRDNTNDAFQAQDRVLLGDVNGMVESKFMERIRQRSEELVRRNTREFQS